WRNASAQIYQYSQFTASGMPTTNFTELDLYTEFRNRMTFRASLWGDNLFTAYCDRCARGGPAVRATPDVNLLINVGADPRGKVAPTFAAIYTVGDYGKSTLWRVRPYVTVRARSNLSWEYRPGSTIFVVWTQGRDQGERDPGSFLPVRDLRNLFSARPNNTFLVKASYWLNF